MDNTELIFKYNGTSEIEVSTLIASLQCVSNSLRAISTDENGIDLSVRIKPFKEGSFEWIFAIEPLVGITSVFYGQLPGDGIIEKFKNMVELVSFFKGDEINKPQIISDNVVQFTNGDGNVKNIKNEIDNSQNYGNGTVIYNIQNLYISSSEEQNISSIELLDKNKNVLTKVSKEEIKDIAKRILETRKQKGEIQLTPIKTQEKKDVYLSVIKPDLNGKTAWKVLFEGNKIEIKIGDENFLKEVNAGKVSFANGTHLIVDLEISQELDKTINLYVNKSWLVTKVHKRIPPLNQQGLLLDI